jgi:predicted acetyltransferase
VPGIYDRVQAETVGMFTRTPDWWKVMRLFQRPGRPGQGEQVRVAIELDGQLEAYALYRVNFAARHMITESTLEISEALGRSRALAAIWRYLLGIDWVARIDASWLPLDHPLLLWLREPRRMRFSVIEAVWVRLVDLGAALAARGLGEGSVVLDVRDEFCPWNTARWSVSADNVVRTTAGADVVLGASELGSVYLGGFTFDQLNRAGRTEEVKPGGIDRADDLFRTSRQPWCPDFF